MNERRKKEEGNAPDWKTKALPFCTQTSLALDPRLEKKVMIDLRIDYLMSG